MYVSKVTKILVILTGFVSIIDAEDDPYRLPYNYEVHHYDIALVIPAESFTNSSSNYSGYVEITFEVLSQTSEVQLHINNSNIDLLTIRLDDTAVLSSENYSVNSTTEILTLQFSTDLTVGRKYTLKIAFNARLMSKNGHGFYKSSYKDHNNVTQYIASTQFQPTRARNAFPCFDEPRYKATFAYNLTYPSDMNALTNTPSLSNATDEITNLTTTAFDVSPRMSVYLVAFVISKYTCTEGVLEGSTEFKHYVCSREDKEYARNFAMSVTPLVIDHLNSYTGINYSSSLSKLDQVAVSGQSGAMENWGLVLYSGLLFDNTIQTNSAKQGIATVIAHELAHQWFGNLVTCKWWSELFLNEGFATMFEYYTPNAVLPHFQMEKQFVIKVMQSVLTTDGFLDVPALRSNASTASEISKKFGSYSYFKGGSVLRMVEHILGKDVFRTGIRKYLSKNAYQSVEPQDLWDALENVTENAVSIFPGTATLSDIMDNWINKGGYPVVNVSLVGTNIIMSQKRFLYSGIDNENSTWYIPISYSTSATDNYNEITTPRGWVTPTDDFVITGFSDPKAWIVVNNQQTGFYRVNYDTTLWENLATALNQANFSGIHVLNRAQILQDSNMLARTGYITFGQALRNAEFLANDTCYFTWYTGLGIFSYIRERTDSTTSLGAALSIYLANLISLAAESVPLTTVNEDDHIFTLNQELINRNACKYGNLLCISAAKTLFSTYKNTYERPNINIRSLIYCNAIRYSDDPVEDWNFLYGQYQNASVSRDSSAIWSALGCATDSTLLNAFLTKILSGDGIITSSHYTSIFSSIYNGNGLGVDIALDFFINNYKAILEKYSGSGLNAGSVLIGLGNVFTKTSQIEKLHNFLKTATNLTQTIVLSANRAISTAKNKQMLFNVHKTSLHSYFGISDNEDTTSSTTTSTTTASTSTTVSPLPPDNDNNDNETGSATILSHTSMISCIDNHCILRYYDLKSNTYLI